MRVRFGWRNHSEVGRTVATEPRRTHLALQPFPHDSVLSKGSGATAEPVSRLGWSSDTGLSAGRSKAIANLSTLGPVVGCRQRFIGPKKVKRGAYLCGCGQGCARTLVVCLMSRLGGCLCGSAVLIRRGPWQCLRPGRWTNSHSIHPPCL